MMFKVSDRKWNRLRELCCDPSAGFDALKDLYKKWFGKKHSIKERIASQQRRAYGQSVSLTKADRKNCTFTETDEQRIRYYLGDTGARRIQIDQNSRKFRPDTKPQRLLLADYDSILHAAVSDRIKDGYTLPLLHLFALLPEEYRQKKFLYRYGDYAQKSPFDSVIAKTRQCDDLSVTLLKLNPIRHWKHVRNVGDCDMDYRGKKDLAIWRGATTGIRKTKGTRTDLVNRLAGQTHSFDVGFSKVVKGCEPQAHLVKGMKSLQEQLQYKFLICLEGNDVASSLKWMLHSNSVVMMPRPSISSWLMEDTLEPFVHYIPLADDFSDAEEQFDWAVNHEDECMEISANASRFMNQFLDPRREILIEYAVFKRYLDQITFY